MIFQNLSHSAQLLAEKINSEKLSDITLAYISPDALSFCQLVATNLRLPLTNLPQNINTLIPPSNLIIVDDGSTPASEFNEYTDRLKKAHPDLNLIIASPIVLETDIPLLQSVSDSLLYLTSSSYLFSLQQFYADTPLV